MTPAPIPATEPLVENGQIPHVQLGEHSYPVYAQRHAYLTNRLGKAAQGLVDLDTDFTSVSDFASMLGDRAYSLLQVFYPKLMPEYEFCGFPTAEAMEQGDYQEEYDKSPSFPQIVEAFQAALKANRLDLVGQLGKIVDRDLLRAFVNKQLVGLLENMPSQTSSSPSIPE